MSVTPLPTKALPNPDTVSASGAPLQFAAPGFDVPNPDYQVTGAVASGIESGFKGSITGTMGRATSYWADRHLADSPVLSEEDHKVNFGDAFQWKQGMTWQEAEDRFQDVLNDGMLAQQTIGHPGAASIGGFIGGMSNPLDMAVMAALPEMKLAAWYSQTGKMGEELLRANAARLSASRLSEAAVNHAATGAALAIVSEPFIYASDLYSQKHHDMLDALHNLGVSTLMGGVMGAGKAAWKAYAPDVRMRLAAAGLSAADQGLKVDPLTGLIAANDNGVKSTLKAGQDILNGVVPPEEIHGMEAPELRKAGFFNLQDLRDTISRVKKKGLSILSPDDPDLSEITLGETVSGPSEYSRLSGAKPREGGGTVHLDTFDNRLDATIQGLRDQLGHLVGPDRTIPPDKLALAQDLQMKIDDLVTRREGLRQRALESQRTAAEQLRVERDAARAKRAAAVKAAAYAPKTDAERLLNEVFRRRFGVDIMFFDDKVAKDNLFYGLTGANEPTRLYVRSGALEGELGMLRIAGHELGHNIRIRDPKLWLAITDSMLSMKDNPTFAKAWKEIVKEKTAKGDWMGAGRNTRMDEVYANTLGHAMDSDHFWKNLHDTSPAHAEELATEIQSLKSSLEKTRTWQESMQGGEPSKRDLRDKQAAEQMSTQLARILSRFEATKDKASRFDYTLKELDPSQTDRGIIMEGYDRQAAKFYARQKEASLRWASVGRRAAYAADSLDRAISGMFYQAGDIKDSSLAPGGRTKVQTVIRTVKGDVKNFLIRSFYADQASKNPAMRRAFEAVVKQRMSAEKGFDRGPLVTWNDLGNGKYEFTFWHDDKHPMWTENREPGDMLIDHDKYLAAEHRDELADGFKQDMEEELAKGIERGEDGKFRSRRESFFENLTNEAGDWAETLTDADRRKMTQNDLVESFRDFLDERMSEALASDDQGQYGNLLDIRKELTDIDATSGVGEDAPNWVKTLYQSCEESRKRAHQEFDEQLGPDGTAANAGIDFNDPKLGTYEFNSGDVLFESLGPALDNLRETMFNDAIERLTNVHSEVTNKKGVRQPDGFSARERPIALYAMMSDKQREFFHTQLRAEIDNIIYDNFPHYREMLPLKDMSPNQADAYFQSLDQMVGSGKDIGPGGRVYDNTTTGSEDYGMSMSPEDAKANYERVVKDREAEADQVLHRAITRLNSEYENHIRWLNDPVKMSEADLRTLLERNQLKDFEPSTSAPQLNPDGTPMKPLERTKAQEAVHSELSAHRRQMEFALDDLARLASGKERFNDPTMTDYIRQRYQYQLRVWDGNRVPALDAAAADIRAYYFNKMRASVINLEARQSLLARARKSTKQLFSFLDGQAREGVAAPGDNVNSRRHVLAEADMQSLHQMLQRHGMQHLWSDGSLVRKVVECIETGKASDPYIKQVADVLRKTNDMQAGRLNKLGSGYRLLQNFAFSQVHDAARISANTEAWHQFLVDNVDWERTAKYAGVNPDDPKSVDRYIEGVMSAIMEPTDGTYDPNTMGGNILNESSMRRTLHFKPGKAFDYDMQFGSGDTGGHIFSSIAHRAEQAAFAEAFGVDRKGNWSSAMTDMGMRFKSKFDDLRLANLTFEHLIGNLDNPVDQSMARLGRSVRQYMNSVSLWMSGISSLTDIGNCVSGVRWAGVPVADAHGAFLAAAKRSMKSERGRVALQGMGAGMDSYLSAYTRTMGDTWFDRMAQKASDFTFKYSGNELSTRVYQEAMMDVLTQHLGNMATSEHNTEFTNWLSHYGITKEMWVEMAKGAQKVEGLEGTRLAPDLIKDEKLAQSLRVALEDTISYGNLHPSISDEALIRMGTRSGTVSGETIRAVGQYKGYALAVVRKVAARFAYGYGNGTGDGVYLGIPTKGAGAREKLVWAASILTLSYMVLGIKDLLHGRDPMNPFNSDEWTLGNIGRVVTQAGVGPLAVVDQFSSPTQVLGPAPGGALRLTGAMFGSNDSATAQKNAGYNRTEALFGMLPGASLAPLTEARRSFLGYVFGQAYGQALDNQRHWLTDQTGQPRVLDSYTPHHRK